MCGIVWTGIDTAGLGMVIAKVARSGFLDRGLLASASGRSRELMQIDIAVWAIIRAQSTAYAPIFNNHFKRIAAANRSHRATDHAQRIATLAARGCDQIILKAQTIANEPGNAIVRVGAGFNALIAAGAAIKIEHQ